MCYNCGCALPDDDMGHQDNITNKTFENLAKEMNSTCESVKNEMKSWLEKELVGDHTKNLYFEKVFNRASQAWGQSIEDAKKETLKLLREEE